MHTSSYRKPAFLRICAALVFAIGVLGCVSDPAQVDPPQENQRVLSLGAYIMLTCTHCRFVSLPSDFDLPKEDRDSCLSYVRNHPNQDRDVQYTAQIECATSKYPTGIETNE